MAVQETEDVSNTGEAVSNDSVAILSADTSHPNMVPTPHAIKQVDRWARDLSHTRYAVLLGASAAIGVLVIGFLLLQEFLLLRALTMGVVMFGLEYTFGAFQTTDG